MDDIFAVVDNAVRKANGSTHPREVADCNHVLVGEPLTGSIIGMAMRFSTLGVIAVNERLKNIWVLLTLWHELAHILLGHVDEPSFNFHRDNGIFTQSIDSKTLSRQEKEANLIAAEYSVNTARVLDLIGYNNRTMQDYRQLKTAQDALLKAYNNLRFSSYADHLPASIKRQLTEFRDAFMELEERKYNLEAELVAMHCFKTFDEIAADLEIDVVILKYKLEALRMRRYDIEVQELEHYSKVFRNAK